MAQPEYAMILCAGPIKITTLDAAAITFIALVEIDDHSLIHGSLVPQPWVGLDFLVREDWPILANIVPPKAAMTAFAYAAAHVAL